MRQERKPGPSPATQYPAGVAPPTLLGGEVEEKGAPVKETSALPAPNLPALASGEEDRSNVAVPRVEAFLTSASSRLTERLVTDLESDFTRSAGLPLEALPPDMIAAGLLNPTNGQLAINNLRVKKPEAYFRLLGQLVPKEMLVAADSDLGSLVKELAHRRKATIEHQRAHVQAAKSDKSPEAQRARALKQAQRRDPVTGRLIRSTND